MKILIVDDDAGLRRSLTLILEDGGHEVKAARSGAEGLALGRTESPELILTDVRMPGMDGFDFMTGYREGGGRAPVVVMTAYGGMDLAIRAMKAGAYDFLGKPFGSDEVLLLVRKVEEREKLRQEVGRLRGEVRTERRFGEIIARSPGMVRALELAVKVAKHPTSVLLIGETGTGKELLARLIHDESDRASGPFVAVNCGAIPENLLESEFFGYARGAFSGAEREKEGLFEAATGGTLLLDEVGELPAPLQVKLLRAIQEGEIRRLGETQTRLVDVRIVAATNRALGAEVEAGRFRDDLYYRIAVVTLQLPPLRQRQDDLPALIHHFLGLHATRLGVAVEGVEPKAMAALLRYAWPGNVRELQNVLERAMVVAEQPQLTMGDLPAPIRGDGDEEGGWASVRSGHGGEDLSVKRRGAALERELIRKALARTDGHRGQAAELLDLSDRALRYKILEYGLDGS